MGISDLIAPRGNSGAFDGLVWFEQVRSEGPRRAFTPARAEKADRSFRPPIGRRATARGKAISPPNKVAQEKDGDAAR